MAKGRVNLRFPLGGINRRNGYQWQPPFTTPGCLNVRPDGNSQGRERGGSRPGLQKERSNQVDGDNPIRALISVKTGEPETAGLFEDDFSGSAMSSANWSAWPSLSLPLLSNDSDDYAYATQADGGIRGALYAPTPLPGLDRRQPFTVTLGGITEHFSSAALSLNQMRLFAAISNVASPLTGSYVAVTLSFGRGASGAYGVSMSQSVVLSGATTQSSTITIPGTYTAGFQFGGDLSLTVGPDTIVSSYRGYTVSFPNLWYTTLTSTRVGFLMLPDSTADANASVTAGSFSFAYTTDDAAGDALVAAADGSAWYTQASGSFTELTERTLNTDVSLQGVDYRGIACIADYGQRKSGTAGVIQNGSLSVFEESDIGVSDVEKGDYLWITSSNQSGNLGRWRIDGVADDALTLETALTADTSMEWTILRAVKFVDLRPWELGGASIIIRSPADLTSLQGNPPPSAPLIAVFNDRLVLGGPEYAPHLWYMSRQGAITDWDFGADVYDPGRAVAGSSSDGSIPASALTALISGGNDYLVLGCANSLWVLRGDPLYGGRLENLSRTIGVVGKFAWCHGPEGQIVFLSRDGVYELAPGASSFPQSISRDVLPRELIDVDPLQYEVQMAFDTRDNGVHIFLTSLGSGSVNHWWMDWPTRSFWPFSLQRDHEPTVVSIYRKSGTGLSDVLLGGRDGYIRRFADAASDDDGAKLSSYVIYGPIPLGGPRMAGAVTELDADLAEDSDDVQWSLYTDDTAEGAVMAAMAGEPAMASGTWEAGGNYRSYPRTRGSAAALRIDSDGAWEIEATEMVVRDAGRRRLS